MKSEHHKTVIYIYMHLLIREHFYINFSFSDPSPECGSMEIQLIFFFALSFGWFPLIQTWKWVLSTLRETRDSIKVFSSLLLYRSHTTCCCCLSSSLISSSLFFGKGEGAKNDLCKSHFLLLIIINDSFMKRRLVEVVQKTSQEGIRIYSYEKGTRRWIESCMRGRRD